MPTLWFVFLLVLVQPEPPRPCAATVVLMTEFDGYYAVYWNGHLRGQGHFVTNQSIGAARLKKSTAWNVGMCVGPVADRNELLIRDRAGKTVLRRSYRKREVTDLLLVYKNDRAWYVTSRQGPMELE